MYYRKKAIRHLVDVNYNSHTNSLFYQLRCLQLHDAYILQCSKLGYKRKLNSLPYYHASKLMFNRELRQSRTRQDDCIALIKPSSFLKINSFNYKIGTAWNNIPFVIKEKINFKKRSEKGFANMMKSFLLKSYDQPCSILNCYICNR